jgi:transposase
VPEVRRLLLAVTEPPEQLSFRLEWSTFRRQHQAVAQRCHRQRRARQQPREQEWPVIHQLTVPELELTDERWARIAALLPPQPVRGRRYTDHRRILSGILWVIRTGAAWREVPAEFGPWETIHSRYQRWRQAGLWPRIFAIVAGSAATTGSEVSL